MSSLSTNVDSEHHFGAFLFKANQNVKKTREFPGKFHLAEEAGFEPARALQLLSVFETDLFNHLSIPPAS
jgi:hypothetical protein